jgi:hypothetical protein
MAFVGMPPTPKHEAMHANNNKTDNRVENLSWGLHHENMRSDRGNNHSRKGEINRNSKLTEEQVLVIRNQYEQRTTYKWGAKALAKQFGICTVQVQRIAHKQIGGWKHV